MCQILALVFFMRVMIGRMVFVSALSMLFPWRSNMAAHGKRGAGVEFDYNNLIVAQRRCAFTCVLL